MIDLLKVDRWGQASPSSGERKSIGLARLHNPQKYPKYSASPRVCESAGSLLQPPPTVSNQPLTPLGDATKPNYLWNSNQPTESRLESGLLYKVLLEAERPTLH